MADLGPLLDDLLTGPGPAADPLPPLLRAVRARRRRRQLAPVAAALALAALATVWLAAPQSRQQAAPEQLTAKVPPRRAPLPLERVHSAPLTAAERLTTTAEFAAVTRVHSGTADTARADDDELLALAGGRGVGLLRHNGRAELLFAGMTRRQPRE